MASAAETESEVELPTENAGDERDEREPETEDRRHIISRDVNNDDQHRQREHSLPHRSLSPINGNRQNINNCNDEHTVQSNQDDVTTEDRARRTEREGRTRRRRVLLRDSVQRLRYSESDDSDSESQYVRRRKPFVKSRREDRQTSPHATGSSSRYNRRYDLGHGDNRGEDNGRARYRSHLPVIKPESFNGTEDWDSYFSHFMNCADLGKWTVEEKALTLSSCLKGSARTFYLGLREHEKGVYRILIRKLSERFGSKKQQTRYITKLETRRRNPGETLESFGDNLRLLAQRAYPDLGADAQESLALYQFYKTISPEMKCRCIDRDGRTIDKAVEIVERHESILGPDDKKRTAIRTITNTPSNIEESQMNDRSDTRESPMMRQMNDILSRLEKSEAHLNNKGDTTNQNNVVRTEQRKVQWLLSLQVGGTLCPKVPTQKDTRGKVYKVYQAVGKLQTVSLSGRGLTEEEWPDDIRHSPSEKPNRIGQVLDPGIWDNGFYTKYSVLGQDVTFLVDNGSSATLLPKRVYHSISLDSRPEIQTIRYTMQGANGQEIEVLGKINISLVLDGCLFTVHAIECDISPDGILGQDFLLEHATNIDYNNTTIYTDRKPINCWIGGQAQARCRVITSLETKIPPSTLVLAPVEIENVQSLSSFALMNASAHLMQKKSTYVVEGVIEAKTDVNVCFINTSDQGVIIPKHVSIGLCESYYDTPDTSTQYCRVTTESTGNAMEPGKIPEHLTDLFEKTK